MQILRFARARGLTAVLAAGALVAASPTAANDASGQKTKVVLLPSDAESQRS